MFTDEPALQAAACEVDRDLWQQRFTRLLRSGVVQFSGLAGGDCGLAAGVRMNGRSAATVLVWLQRTLAGPLQAGAGVALDLSGADNAARVVWRAVRWRTCAR